MSHPLLDPRRLALLHALGLQQAWVPRAALSAVELARLPPRLPLTRRAEAAPTQRVPESRPARADPSPPPPRRESPAAAPPAIAAATRAAAPPAAQRLQQIAALDWQPLHDLTAECRACKLGTMRHRAVFGVGHRRARLMVVGEAPGAEEDRLGEPFVGAAGRLLDNMLGACGMRRSGEDASNTVYIANVIKCRPPGNRNPEADEIAQCLPILQRQIELVQPRLLLALGRFAAQALTGSAEPIGRLRQRRWDWRGIPLLVSYHPAYLLRSPLDKAKAWADLCLALDLLEGLPAAASAP